MMNRTNLFRTPAGGLLLALLAAGPAVGQDFSSIVPGTDAESPPMPAAEIIPLAPLPELEPQDPVVVALGELLFFDNRASGNADQRCYNCHNPRQGWTDGISLSDGYPGTKYFRNSKTIINVAYAPIVYWDGHMTGGAGDLDSQVRDSITESYFQAMDGRIMLQRWKQVPEYVERFQAAFNAEPDFELTLTAISAFMRTLVSKNVPFDNYLKGDSNAISAQAKNGLALFQGKAGCIQCHSGPMLSDYQPHALGVPENPYVFVTPKRHTTYRAFLRNLGVPNRYNWLEDVGHYVTTKERKHIGTFITPSLREVSRTPPYMHNGMLPSLEEVVEFYDQGGAEHPNKDSRLHPLGLSEGEKAELVEFLRTLSGDQLIPEDMENRLVNMDNLPAYETVPWMDIDN